ncbi:hypothetical protein D3C81_2143020 [compost metagenome]
MRLDILDEVNASLISDATIRITNNPWGLSVWGRMGILCTRVMDSTESANSSPLEGAIPVYHRILFGSLAYRANS